MAKNIIVCSDGTGNTAIKGRGTNVFKIFEAIDLNSHRYDPSRDPQVAIYDDGVGTESVKLLKLLGGVFGVGLSRNVRQLYKELCRIYDPGDRIYLFGFSRGAFTVRTLVGLIHYCGILKTAELHDNSELEQLVNDAYRGYRRRYRTKLMTALVGEPDLDELARLKQERSHGKEHIELVGVWDTVDAVGLPFPMFASFVNATLYQFKFPSSVLSPIVKRAYHALAIDDERHSFEPLLWTETGAEQANAQVIEQVWFSGAHSNVGGGYPKQGMSLVALDWMMKHAQDAGLRFIGSERMYYREHTNVDDKLYNPRAGLGRFYRWQPRDIAKLCQDKCRPKLHMSALERAAHGTEDYAPGNLPPQPEIVFTATGHDAQDRAATERADKLQTVIAALPPLMHDVRHTIALGRYAYVILMTTLLLAAPLTSGLFGLLPALWLLLLSLALALPMAYFSQRRRQQHYSSAWLKMQKQLRSALKSTRTGAEQPDAGQLSSPSHMRALVANRSDGSAENDSATEPTRSRTGER